MKIKTVLIVVLIVVLATSVAIAGKGPGAGPRKSCCPVDGVGVKPQIVREFKLTRDQVAQISKIKQDFISATKTAREQLQAKMKEMAGLWTNGEPDIEAIRVLFSEIDALRAEIRDAGLTRLIQVIKVLNNAQKAKLKEILKKQSCCCCCVGCCCTDFCCITCCVLGVGPCVCCADCACPVACEKGCPMGCPCRAKGCCSYVRK